MKLDQFVSTASDAITVRRVFAEPYEKNGTTVIAAARVQGGGGGGGGHDKDNQEGEGGGFGLAARPAGAYVIRDGKVSWQPRWTPRGSSPLRRRCSSCGSSPAGGTARWAGVCAGGDARPRPQQGAVGAGPWRGGLRLEPRASSTSEPTSTSARRKCPG